MVVNKNLFVKTNKELITIIKDYKKSKCPTHSGKSKEQLINIVEELNLVKPKTKTATKTATKPKPTPKPIKINLPKNLKKKKPELTLALIPYSGVIDKTPIKINTSNTSKSSKSLFKPKPATNTNNNVKNDIKKIIKNWRNNGIPKKLIKKYIDEFEKDYIKWNNNKQNEPYFDDRNWLGEKLYLNEKIDIDEYYNNNNNRAATRANTKPVSKSKYTIDDFLKSKQFLVEAIKLYYSDKSMVISNLDRTNIQGLKKLIIKKNIPIDELVKHYNQGIDNALYFESINNNNFEDDIKRTEKRKKRLNKYKSFYLK